MRAVVYASQARKDLKRLPRDLSDRVRTKLNQLANDPAALANNVTALKGEEALRLRIGDWRVIFSLTKDQIIVHRVAPRGSAYR